MVMRKCRGLRLGRRLIGVCRWILSGRHRRYRRLAPDRSPAAARMVAKMLRWALSLCQKTATAAAVCGGKGAVEEWCMLGREVKPMATPKGHLVVYVGVGEKGMGPPPRRYVVPIIYFNHPLFGELLRETEEEFGFHHPGGITIPCPASRFELVQTRIAAVACRQSGCRIFY